MREIYKEIYVVMGRTGKGIKHVEWDIAAYTNMKTAREHAQKATTRAEDLHVTIDSLTYKDYKKQELAMSRDEIINKFDPDMRFTEYYAISYYIETVFLYDGVNDFLESVSEYINERD